MRKVVLSFLAMLVFAITPALAQTPEAQHEVSLFGRAQSATTDLADRSYLIGAGYAYVGAPTRFVTFGLGTDLALAADDVADKNLDLRVKLLSRLNLSQNLQLALGAGYLREGFLAAGANGWTASGGVRVRGNSGVGVFADYAIEHLDESRDAHFPFAGEGPDRYSLTLGLFSAF